MTTRLERMSHEPSREAVDRFLGPVVLEFGASWCGFCQGLAPQLEAELAAHPDVRAIWVEDGPGRPLGRSFRVKLWPTLVFLRDGAVIRQMSRPSLAQMREGFAALANDDPQGGGQVGNA